MCLSWGHQSGPWTTHLQQHNKQGVHGMQRNSVSTTSARSKHTAPSCCRCVCSGMHQCSRPCCSLQETEGWPLAGFANSAAPTLTLCVLHISLDLKWHLLLCFFLLCCIQRHLAPTNHIRNLRHKAPVHPAAPGTQCSSSIVLGMHCMPSTCTGQSSCHVCRDVWYT